MEYPPNYAGWKQRDIGNVLYRCWDDAGRLLYVGVTNSFRQRLWHHRNGTPWWGSVAEVTTTDIYPSRNAALRAERMAIRAEKPQHNKERYASTSLDDGLQEFLRLTEGRSADEIAHVLAVISATTQHMDQQKEHQMGNRPVSELTDEQLTWRMRDSRRHDPQRSGEARAELERRDIQRAAELQRAAEPLAYAEAADVQDGGR